VRFHERLPIDRLAAPILALDQDVGLDRANNFLGARLVEHHDVIDRFQSGQDSRAFSGRIDRARVALERLDASIAVETDHQQVGLRARERENLDMARVKQVETSIGECNPAPRAALAAKRRLQFVD